MGQRKKNTNTSEHIVPLDDQEQDELIQNIEAVARKNVIRIEIGYFVVCLMLEASIGVLAFSKRHSSESMRFLERNAEKWIILTSYFFLALSVVSSLLTAYGVHVGSKVGFASLILLSLAWTYYFVKNSESSLVLLWYPLTCLAILLFGFHIRKSVESILKAPSRLESLKYKFKKV